MLTETEKAYLAGIVDGEGAVTIVELRSRGPGYEHYIGSLEITNTNMRLVEWVKSRIGHLLERIVIDRRRVVKGQKPVYRLCFRNQRAEEVLRVIYPYLVIKARQAELVFELRSRMRSNVGAAKDCTKLSLGERAYRKHLNLECAKLNVRGTGNAERLSERSPETGVRQSELAGNELQEGEPKSLPASE
jgi:hypothetical protein